MLTKKFIDLNYKRPIGKFTKLNWPGFSSKIVSDQNQIHKFEVTENDSDQEKPEREDTKLGKYGGITRKRINLPQAYRGFSGQQLNGMRIDNPPNTEDCNFDDFETQILRIRYVGVAQGKTSKKDRLSCIVACGNGKGVLGIGYGKSRNKMNAISSARSSAIKNLIRYNLCEDRTVYHSCLGMYHRTKMIIYRKEPRHGLRCQRVVEILCRLIGIKDLRVKIEKNSKNTDSVVHAFLDAILNMVNFQQR